MLKNIILVLASVAALAACGSAPMRSGDTTGSAAGPGSPSSAATMGNTGRSALPAKEPSY